MGDPAVPVIAEAELFAAPPGRTARRVLKPDYADAQVAAVARDLAAGVLLHIEAMLADPPTDLPAEAGKGAGRTRRRAGRADQRWATVTALDTPLALAWGARPAGRGR